MSLSNKYVFPLLREFSIEWQQLSDKQKEYNTTILTNVERKSHLKEKEEGYQRINPDFTIKIPSKVAEKLHWGVGSEVWIDVLDEDLSQAIVGKKVRGEEARNSIERLQRLMSGEEE